MIGDFGDERVLAWCAMCGGPPDTRDHLPARIFLDDPLPEEMAVVGVCHQCNNGASRDEQYLACLVECALFGSTSPDRLQREKIKRTLERRPAIQSMLEAARRLQHGTVTFGMQIQRVRRVVLKLARGHSMYELHEQHFEEPQGLIIAQLSSLSEDRLKAFEGVSLPQSFPEVGSRAMQRLVCGAGSEPYPYSGWIEVQPSRYRFAAIWGPPTIIRIVFSEYLAAEVVWDEV